jgi:hypothetical protein
MAEVAKKIEFESPENRSELDAPIWSVLSFARQEASGLTYDEAVRKCGELDAASVAGLCIVTDEAASRISST